MTLHPSERGSRSLQKHVCRLYSALTVQFERNPSLRKVERLSPLPRIPQSALHRCDSHKTLLSTSCHRRQQLIARPALRTCPCSSVRFTSAYVWSRRQLAFVTAFSFYINYPMRRDKKHLFSSTGSYVCSNTQKMDVNLRMRKVRQS
jgi:hypothetical protein